MDTWQRPPSPPNDPTLAPEELEEVRSKIQIPRLTEAEAPSLASQHFESANENSKSTDNNVDHLNQSASSNTPAGESSIPPLTTLKRVSSFGSRTIAIIGILSLMTAFGLGVVLFSKSEWNLQAWRSAYESLTANFPNLVSARDRATPSSTLPAPVASAPESNPSETTTQLQSFGKELGSLREDMRSLAEELAQIRKTQAQLLTSQNQLVLETQRFFARSQADNVGRSSTAEKTAKPPKGQKRPHPGIFPPFF